MKIEVARPRLHGARQDQRAFRVLLEAFSYPGKIVTFEGEEAAHVTVLSTLADETTSLWIDAGFAGVRAMAAAACWPLADRQDCTFALCRGERLACLDGFPMGSLADPHLSVTIIAEVERLSGGTPLRLAGPGVGPHGRTLAPYGLPATFPAAWARNNAAYPLGVDLILTAGGLCTCLPRSVRLEMPNVCSG